MRNIIDIKFHKKQLRFWFPFKKGYYGFWFFFLVFDFILIFFSFLGVIQDSINIKDAIPVLGMVFFITIITYGLCRGFFLLRIRLLPNHYRIIAVEIVSSKKKYGWFGPVGISFRGAGISRMMIASVGLSALGGGTGFSSIMVNMKAQRLNTSQFKRCPKLIYLDENRKIVLAAELKEAGGAVLLDEELYYLLLSDNEKKQMLKSLYQARDDILADTTRLEQVIADIPREVDPLDNHGLFKKKLSPDEY